MRREEKARKKRKLLPTTYPSATSNASLMVSWCTSYHATKSPFLFLNANRRTIGLHSHHDRASDGLSAHPPLLAVYADRLNNLSPPAPASSNPAPRCTSKSNATPTTVAILAISIYTSWLLWIAAMSGVALPEAQLVTANLSSIAPPSQCRGPQVRPSGRVQKI